MRRRAELKSTGGGRRARPPGIAVAASQDSKVPPDAHRTKPNVKIGKPDGEQAHPRPKHVAAVETRHAAIRLMAERRFGRFVEEPADQVAKRMTTKRVAAQQDEIPGQ